MPLLCTAPSKFSYYAVWLLLYSVDERWPLLLACAPVPLARVHLGVKAMWRDCLDKCCPLARHYVLPRRLLCRLSSHGCTQRMWELAVVLKPQSCECGSYFQVQLFSSSYDVLIINLLKDRTVLVSCTIPPIMRSTLFLPEHCVIYKQFIQLNSIMLRGTDRFARPSCL